ncbi:MAG: extracellular solute-binding protein [Lachnospiraceae bacterium]
MKKRLVSMTLTAVMAISLAACGSSGTSGESTTEGASSAQTAAASDTEAASSSDQANGETTEITFWHTMDGTAGEILQKQVDTFNETVGAEKGIHVTPTYQDWPGTDALTAAMATDDTDNMPDVIQLFGESVDVVRDWDRTAWVEDYITRDDSTVKKDDLLDAARTSYEINGKMIGAPYALSTLLLYYNKDLLSQAGYDAPATTLDELAEQMSAIKDKTDADYALNLRMSYFEFVTYIMTQGAEGSDFGNNDNGHTGYMTELTCQDQVNAFLDGWQKVIDTGALKPTKDSVTEEFAQGLNAMTMLSSSRIAEVSEMVGDSFDWGVAPIPTVNEGDLGGGYPSGSGLFMIDRGDEAKLDAAWEFVSWCMSADAQCMWLDGYSYVPVNKNALDSDAYKQAVADIPEQETPYDILSTMPDNMVAPFCPASDSVSSVIQDAILNFAQGSATKEETSDAIVNGIQDAFDEYYRANPVSESGS